MPITIAMTCSDKQIAESLEVRIYDEVTDGYETTNRLSALLVSR